MEASEKEALGRKEERIQKADKIFKFLSLLSIAAIVFCLLFPHGTFIFLTVLFILCWLVSLGVKLTKGAVSLPFLIYPAAVVCLFGMAWVFMIIPIMEVIFCRHRPWEYAMEINFYKAMDTELSYFPQKLPWSARNVEWIVVPTVWQAKGCLVLAFDTNERYIQQCIERYNTQKVDIYAEFSKKYCDEDYRHFCDALDIDAFDMSINPLLPQYVELSLEEVETAVDYQIDRYGSQGFIVVEESNRIIFYRDYEW